MLLKAKEINDFDFEALGREAMTAEQRNTLNKETTVHLMTDEDYERAAKVQVLDMIEYCSDTSDIRKTNAALTDMRDVYQSVKDEGCWDASKNRVLDECIGILSQEIDKTQAVIRKQEAKASGKEF